MTLDDKDITLMQTALNMCYFSNCLSRGICVITTDTEKNFLSYGINHWTKDYPCGEVRNPEGKKECPRRTLGFKSGEGMVICPGIHAERDALDNTPYSCDIFMYCACGIPCLKCTTDIISDGRVKRIYCLLVHGEGYPKNEYYFDESFRLLLKNNIDLIEIDKSYLL